MSELRIRTEIVALDEDLGCMVALYNADTDELLSIGVDPPAPGRDEEGPDEGFASMCPRCGRGLVSRGEWCCGGWTQ